MTYHAYVTRIHNVRKHPNADRLLIGNCFGNNVVIGIDTRDSQLGLYFPTDGQISTEFLVANNLLRVKNEDGTQAGGLFDMSGRVKTQRLRGEKSDGFWIPITSLAYTGVNYPELPEGSIINDVNGHHLCHKYTTPATKMAWQHAKRDKPKDNYPLFHKHIDTEQLAYNLSELTEGDVLTITEKLHGTSGRSSNTIKETTSKFGRFINSIFKKTVIAPRREWAYICGSRNVTLVNLINYQGFYGGDDERFRSEAHNQFVGHLHRGETVYYEIVGWANETTPLMPKCQNSKLQDKEFVKRYGKETTFAYGCSPGTNDVYVYRMTIMGEDGYEIDYDYPYMYRRCASMGVKTVPLLSTVILCPGVNILRTSDALVSRESTIDPSHIMEGCVIRIGSTEWRAFKYKSFEFKVLEGIIKSTGVSDIEESS
jgi:hypothetical protein